MAPITIWFFAMAAIFGLIFGSFSGVVIGRKPLSFLALIPGSRCDECKSPIRWYQNVPVLSFLVLRGRCASCGAKIPIWSPMLELLSGLIFVTVFANFVFLDLSGQPTADSLLVAVIMLGFASNSLCLSILGWQTTEPPRLLLLIGVLWALVGFASMGWLFGAWIQFSWAVVGSVFSVACVALYFLLSKSTLNANFVWLGALLGLNAGWFGPAALLLGLAFILVLLGLAKLCARFFSSSLQLVERSLPGVWIIGTWFGLFCRESVLTAIQNIIR